jgi:hypothetical protein
LKKEVREPRPGRRDNPTATREASLERDIDSLTLKTCPVCFAIAHDIPYHILYQEMGFVEMSTALSQHEQEGHEKEAEA